ncbi:MAG: aminotransferase class I/II-fold pyridoxal phosphate-dependent enzyme [Acidobacteriota bacterium]
MRLDQFEMERLQSTWENRVKFNLSESSVHPMSPRELVADPDSLERLMDMPLIYNQSNGTDELRSAIAACYPGATLDHVEVTNGGSEANFISIFSMLEPGDEVAIILPNYQQIWGLIRSFGMVVNAVSLREDLNWAPDLAQLEAAVSPRTRMIILCNPNNPTGAILTAAEMDTIVRIAARSGAWILCDEIYQGSERDGQMTPTFWGKYDRVIITNGLSKAYGLPGLRIGWIVAPKHLIAKMWSYHDYTTIAPGTLSDCLAQIALAPEGRDLSVNSTVLIQRLLTEKSVLVVPGDHFGMDHYLRIGYGPPPEYLKQGLELIREVIADFKQDKSGTVTTTPK